jgi:glycosyltransferase involved in cell wall biosynthesis
MRIAQVAPLFESVPPRRHGGTERMVHALCEGLVALGHDVTLFATADARTSASVVPVAPRALRGYCDDDPGRVMAWHVLLVEAAMRRAPEFDALHFHLDHLHLPPVIRAGLPHVTTLRARLDLPEVGALLRAFPEAPFVAVSDAQRKPASWARWLATVRPGLDPADFAFGKRAADYLAFVGRASPETGLDEAVLIARRAGLPLRIAAPVAPADQAWFEATIAPALGDPGITFLGEIDTAARNALLSRARALLHPIAWPEPFGLELIEAMACGTPVVAYRAGAVAEVVDHGLTGFVVADRATAADAVLEVGRLDRFVCREVFESRFGHLRMARDYLSVYAEVTAGAPMPAGETPRSVLGPPP